MNDGYDLKALFSILKISSPVFLYFLLLVLLRVAIEKIHFLKNPALQNAIPIVKGILHFFIILTSIIYALGIFNIDIQGIMAGLGLFSFAAGFALKDVISNSISGLSILIYKPFKVGDVIAIDNYTGKVLKMDIRYTILEDENKDLYFIPNSYIIGAKIVLKKPPSQK